MANIRRLSAVALLSALALSATGCAAAAGDDAAGAGDSFTYWSMWKEGEAQQKVIAGAIADFEEETGIEVDVEWMGRDNVKKVVATLNSRNVPDLIDGSYANLAPILAEAGQAAPLTDAFKTDAGDAAVNDVIPSQYLGVEGLYLEDGEPWMLPYSLSSDAMWFNAAAHPELAETPPATWDDFIATLDELKAGGVTPIAADGDIPGYNAYWYSSAIVRIAGVGSLREMAADETGEAWEAPEALEAAETVAQLVDGGYLAPGYDASKWPAQQQLWADDGAALLFNGSWIPTETATYAADGFEYASFPYPSLTGEKYARSDFVGFAVPKKADGSDAAQQFAAHLLNSDYQQALATDAKVLPIRDGIDVAPELTTVQKALSEADELYQQNDGIAFSGYNEKLFWPASDRLFLGKTTPEQFIQEMKAGQIEYWENNS